MKCFPPGTLKGEFDGEVTECVIYLTKPLRLSVFARPKPLQLCVPQTKNAPRSQGTLHIKHNDLNTLQR